MNPLKKRQKELLFDHCIGITPEKETAKAEALINTRTEAVEIHTKLEASLAPLESIRPESCPNLLAEQTIFRILSTLTDSSHYQCKNKPIQLSPSPKPHYITS